MTDSPSCTGGYLSAAVTVLSLSTRDESGTAQPCLSVVPISLTGWGKLFNPQPVGGLCHTPSWRNLGLPVPIGMRSLWCTWACEVTMSSTGRLVLSRCRLSRPRSLSPPLPPSPTPLSLTFRFYSFGLWNSENIGTIPLYDTKLDF